MRGTAPDEVRSLMFEIIAHAAVEVATANTAREWAVQRPAYGVHAPIVREAARVPDRWKPYAICVLDRESGATLNRPQSGAGARNPASTASGRWQFLDTPWRINGGLDYMVADRLRDHGLPQTQARQVRVWLDRTPIYRWPGLYQDIGFVAVVTSGGAHHWNGHTCNRYLP